MSIGIEEAVPEHGGDGGEVVSEAAVGQPLRKDAWKRFRRNHLAMVGLAFICLMILVAIFADVLAPYGITERPVRSAEPPSWDHPFGTDTVGQDVFSRVIHGARVSLRISFLACSIALFIGISLGAMAGFFGGIIDTLIMRTVDVFLAIPYIILAVAIATVVGRSENSVIFILGALLWLGIARVVRASFLSLKQLEYIEAARALGFSRLRIMFRHMLPNAMQPVIVYGTILIGTAILTEAALSFLGVGPQDPTPAWGLMVGNAKGRLADAPHMLMFPGAAIFLTVLAFVFVGDGLRDALDPKLR